VPPHKLPLRPNVHSSSDNHRPLPNSRCLSGVQFSPWGSSQFTFLHSCPKPVCSQTVTVTIATKTASPPLASSPVDCAPRHNSSDALSTSTDSEASPTVEEEHIWGRQVVARTRTNPTNAQFYDTVSIGKPGPDLTQICIHSTYRNGSESTASSSSSPFTPFSVTIVNSSPEHDMEQEEIRPKLEELDELELPDVKPIEATVVDANPSSTTLISGNHAPKKRGRPRKHPIPPATGAAARTAKGRSKTGCITCRRRKKKCDETKPSCLNCQKNAVVCEGYPPKEIWRSGRQKAEAGRILTTLLTSLLTNHQQNPVVDPLLNFPAPSPS
jgi:hypothetical protein